jgi:hypothetical protein
MSVRGVNDNLFELYKCTDMLIKDAYSSSSGISEYIELMENNRYKSEYYNIPNWKRDYNNLKKVRWIRNRLAHDVSKDCDIGAGEYYAWFCDFYDSLCSASDPMAMLRKCEEAKKQRKRQNAQAQKKSVQQTAKKQTVNAPLRNQPNVKNEPIDVYSYRVRDVRTVQNVKTENPPVRAKKKVSSSRANKNNDRALACALGLAFCLCIAAFIIIMCLY